MCGPEQSSLRTSGRPWDLLWATPPPTIKLVVAQPGQVIQGGTQLDIVELAKQARRNGEAAFVQSMPGLYLLARPGDEAEPDLDRMGFDTVAARIEPTEGSATSEWLVYPIRKKPENPFPHQISVGRATSCDIVARFSFVSKMHAFFGVDDRENFSLGDHRSANGTWLNQERLEPGEKRSVGLGDRIAFGPLNLQVVDARALYRALMSPQFAAWEVSQALSQRGGPNYGR